MTVMKIDNWKSLRVALILFLFCQISFMSSNLIYPALKPAWSVGMSFLLGKDIGLTYDKGFKFYFRISSATSENNQGSVDDVARVG